MNGWFVDLLSLSGVIGSLSSGALLPRVPSFFPTKLETPCPEGLVMNAQPEVCNGSLNTLAEARTPCSQVWPGQKLPGMKRDRSLLARPARPNMRWRKPDARPV